MQGKGKLLIVEVRIVSQVVHLELENGSIVLLQ